MTATDPVPALPPATPHHPPKHPWTPRPPPTPTAAKRSSSTSATSTTEPTTSASAKPSRSTERSRMPSSRPSADPTVPAALDLSPSRPARRRRMPCVSWTERIWTGGPFVFRRVSRGRRVRDRSIPRVPRMSSSLWGTCPLTRLPRGFGVCSRPVGRSAIATCPLIRLPIDHVDLPLLPCPLVRRRRP